MIEMDETSQIKKSILQCSISNRYLIFIPAEGYSFAGSFRFQCLIGAVSVSGYTMKNAPFDENNFIQFTVHNKAQIPMNFTPTINEEISDSESLFQRIRLIMEGNADDFKAYSQYPAVILVDVEPSVVESYLTGRIGEYHKPLDKFKYHKVAGDCYIVQGLRMGNGLVQKLDFHIPHTDSIHEAIDYVRSRGTSMMVLGNKGVGKSTTVRYIVNHLLSNTNSTVYLLDTDIGQTEFTPPGCISLIRLNAPPFLHEKLTFPNTFCIGSLSPGGLDFNLYATNVHRLVQDFDDINDPKKFMVVNTHGWVDDFGQVIMKKLIQTVRPATLFNLHSLDQQISNFDIPTLMPGHHYHHYPVSLRINSQTSKEINGKTWREYAITGYFANCLADERFGKPSPERTLANLLSYQIFFNKISLFFHYDHPPVKDNLILSSLNCSVVALCGFAYGALKSNLAERHVCGNPLLPKVIIARDPKLNPALKCYGFGFIRAISADKKIFYIISPISPEDCGKVEILFVPHNITAPSYMFDRDDARSAPYLVEFKNEEERRIALQNRDQCFRQLSTKFQNNTGPRNAQRLANSGTVSSEGPPPKRRR